jgi:hypothetical protein
VPLRACELVRARRFVCERACMRVRACACVRGYGRAARRRCVRLGCELAAVVVRVVRVVGAAAQELPLY